jgi:transposase
MELTGALSNPLESRQASLGGVRNTVLALRQRGGERLKPRSLPGRPGKVADAVRAVVATTHEPVRMVEIHAAVESHLGEPVNRSTVKEALSAGVARLEYRRVARGFYLRGATTGSR